MGMASASGDNAKVCLCAHGRRDIDRGKVESPIILGKHTNQQWPAYLHARYV